MMMLNAAPCRKNILVLTLMYLGGVALANQLGTVSGEPEEAAEELPPEFLSPPSNITVAVGREAILDCPVKQLGDYRVAWLRAEDQTVLTLHTRVVTHSTRMSINHDTNTHSWRLHIRGIRETDRGCYMCQVNYRVMKKQLRCIDVLGPPNIIDEETSGDVTVSEGGNITLQCRGRGNPQPKISWRREDSRPVLSRRSRDSSVNETVTGEQLVLTRVDRQQKGAIFCIASNDVPPAVSKRILIHVTFKPSVTVPVLSYGSPLGGDVTMQCEIEAYPGAISFWKFKPGTKQERILNNGTKYSVAENRTGYSVVLRVVILNLSRADLGEYQCFASNGVGEGESGVVRIHETERITLPPTTRVVFRTTTPRSTPRPTTTSARTTTLKMSRHLTTRVPLAEIAENTILGDIIVETKGRKTKSSSYQSHDGRSNAGTALTFTNTLYTICFVLLYLLENSEGAGICNFSG